LALKSRHFPNFSACASGPDKGFMKRSKGKQKGQEGQKRQKDLFALFALLALFVSIAKPLARPVASVQSVFYFASDFKDPPKTGELRK
jgi:hypothetical protein